MDPARRGRGSGGITQVSPSRILDHDVEERVAVLVVHVVLEVGVEDLERNGDVIPHRDAKGAAPVAGGVVGVLEDVVSQLLVHLGAVVGGRVPARGEDNDEDGEGQRTTQRFWFFSGLPLSGSREIIEHMFE